MKEMIKKALVDGYKEIAYTDKYIYGFYDKKVVYEAFGSLCYRLRRIIVFRIFPV